MLINLIPNLCYSCLSCMYHLLSHQHHGGKEKREAKIESDSSIGESSGGEGRPGSSFASVISSSLKRAFILLLYFFWRS